MKASRRFSFNTKSNLLNYYFFLLKTLHITTDIVIMYLTSSKGMGSISKK
uniref:Uncharacterized protein n=1 Tax=Polysiphonia sertularioides TaxID=945028 RepID=A0A1Z1MGL3_9FLOR|nr:hypothetical protein [Polysiphonia sertularioides]